MGGLMVDCAKSRDEIDFSNGRWYCHGILKVLVLLCTESPLLYIYQFLCRVTACDHCYAVTDGLLVVIHPSIQPKHPLRTEQSSVTLVPLR